MQTISVSVPDTRDVPPPLDWPWKSAMWLLGRHSRLVELARRIPGVLELDAAGDWSIDTHALAEVFAAAPKYSDAWDEYEHSHRKPGGYDDAAYERWHAAGPKAEQFAPGLSSLLVMSSGETKMLRLLATFASPVPFSVSMLSGLDAGGRRLVRDWLDAAWAS